MKKYSEFITEAGQPFTGYRPREANDAAALGAEPHAMGEKEFMDLHKVEKAPYLNDSQAKIFNGEIDQPFPTPGHEGNDRGKGNPPKSGKLAEKGEKDDTITQGGTDQSKFMTKLFGKRTTDISTKNEVPAQQANEQVEVEEGKLKQAAEKDAGKMSKAQFAKKYGKDVADLFYENEEVQEALDKDDEPALKKIIDKLKGASKAHAGQAKDLETAIKEGKVLDTLKKIVKDKSAQKVKFKNGKTLTVDMTTANVITQVVAALKPANQKKFADQLEKGPNAFMKMVDFAFSAVK